MDSDTALTLGVIAVGGYAVYRLMNPIEKAINTATDAAGDIFKSPAVAPAGTYVPQVTTSNGSPKVTTPTSPLYTLNPYNAPQNILTQMFNEISDFFTRNKGEPVKITPFVDAYVPGAPNFTTTTGQNIFVDTSGKLPKSPNFSSISGKDIFVPAPKTGKKAVSMGNYSGASVAQLTQMTSLKPGGGFTGLPSGTYNISGLGSVSVRSGGRGVGGAPLFPV